MKQEYLNMERGFKMDFKVYINAFYKHQLLDMFTGSIPLVTLQNDTVKCKMKDLIKILIKSHNRVYKKETFFICHLIKKENMNNFSPITIKYEELELDSVGKEIQMSYKVKISVFSSSKLILKFNGLLTNIKSVREGLIDFIKSYSVADGVKYDKDFIFICEIPLLLNKPDISPVLIRYKDLGFNSDNGKNKEVHFNELKSKYKDIENSKRNLKLWSVVFNRNVGIDTTLTSGHDIIHAVRTVRSDYKIDLKDVLSIHYVSTEERG